MLLPFLTPIKQENTMSFAKVETQPKIMEMPIPRLEDLYQSRQTAYSAMWRSYTSNIALEILLEHPETTLASVKIYHYLCGHSIIERRETFQTSVAMIMEALDITKAQHVKKCLAHLTELGLIATERAPKNFRDKVSYELLTEKFTDKLQREERELIKKKD